MESSGDVKKKGEHWNNFIKKKYVNELVEYCQKLKEYAKEHDIDLSKIPFIEEVY